MNKLMKGSAHSAMDRRCMEEEFHFLLQCDTYNIERDILLQELQIDRHEFQQLDKLEQLSIILTNVHQFGRYLNSIFNKRRKKIYQV